MIYHKMPWAEDYPKERIKLALQFLSQSDLAALVPGSVIPIDGTNVYAQVQEYTTGDADLLRFETHDVYFDVHYLVRGTEFFGCLPRGDLQASTAYDAVNDITFYDEPLLAGKILLREGEWVIVSPAEAHKPRCIANKAELVKKIVIKVKA